METPEEWARRIYDKQERGERLSVPDDFAPTGEHVDALSRLIDEKEATSDSPAGPAQP